MVARNNQSHIPHEPDDPPAAKASEEGCVPLEEIPPFFFKGEIGELSNGSSNLTGLPCLFGWSQGRLEAEGKEDVHRSNVPVLGERSTAADPRLPARPRSPRFSSSSASLALSCCTLRPKIAPLQCQANAQYHLRPAQTSSANLRPSQGAVRLLSDRKLGTMVSPPHPFGSSSSSTSSPPPPPPRQSHRRRRILPPVGGPCLCLLVALAALAAPAEAHSTSPFTPRLADLRTHTSPASLPRLVDRSTNETAAAKPTSTRQLSAEGLDVGISSLGVASEVGSSGQVTSVVGNATASATTGAAVATSTAVPANYTMPMAFDATLGTAFTSTACPSFFQTFLADETFIACAPFSLLLSTSTAFFNAEKSPNILLPYVLDATCAPSSQVCLDKMSLLATQIRLPGTCGPDLALSNALAVEALVGFQNYELMRSVGCQKNNVTSQYCFAEAAAQTTASEVYFYYLPTGTSLPSGTTTTCGPCTQGLMSILASYATNSSLLISKTYAGARTVVSTSCGPNFAPVVVAVVSGGSSVFAQSISPFALALVTSSAFWLLVSATL